MAEAVQLNDQDGKHSDDSERPEIQEMISKASKYDFIRVQVADLGGISRGKTVTSKFFTEKVAFHGLGMFEGIHAISASSGMHPMEGFGTFADCVIKVIPSTFHHVAWGSKMSSRRVASVLGETKWRTRPDQGNPFQEACSRFACRKQVEKLANMGYKIKASSEFEFMVTEDDKVTLLKGHNQKDAYCITAQARYDKMLFDISDQLSDTGLGINVESIHTEFGPSQFEITLEPRFGMEYADNAFIFKHAVKEICQHYGLHATFISEPFKEFKNSPDCHVWNSLHFNHSLWTIDEKAAFYDPSKEDKLSNIAKWWIGGICKHARALTAFMAPTVNCYRRFATFPFIPKMASWGIRNRLKMLRVKVDEESSTYIENRVCSGASNSYLVLACHIAAGIDGILNEIEPPAQDVKEGVPLPLSLDESLDALKEDVLICDALGPELVDWFVTSRKNLDIKELGNSVHAYDEAYAADRRFYMDVL
ncbi:unnamed protein product [Owenia fusiformis]|uniref:Lengsin n=1 Tax=Owenia fusiformis TaxID=6347 RepID=A0A8J1XWG9_OWEFU|nr:unnamed protein product [Owenia fusiformis]